MLRFLIIREFKPLNRELLLLLCAEFLSSDFYSNLGVWMCYREVNGVLCLSEIVKFEFYF